MILSLPSLPHITIWFQANPGGRRLPEHLAPGFDESCRYLEYKPSDDFIFLIHTERKDDTLPQRLAFLIEIDGKETSYFPVCAPRGFGANGRAGKSYTISIRQDFAETKKLFRFPASGTLGQIIIRVFILKPLVNVPTSPADSNIYKWRYTTRDIRQYSLLNDSEVHNLTAGGLEDMLFKHVDDEPAAVFRFKHRTSEELQEMSAIPSVPKLVSKPVSKPAVHPSLLAHAKSFPVVAEQPAQALPKLPNHQFAYAPIPKPFPNAVEPLAQPFNKTPALPSNSVQRPTVNLPPIVVQSSAQSENNAEPRLQLLESYRDRLAALHQRLRPSEEPLAHTGRDEDGRPYLHLLESYRKGPSDMRRSLAPVDENSYIPPAVPQFGSVPQVLKEMPAQAQNSKAAEQPLGSFANQHTAFGRIGQMLQKPQSWGSLWGTVQFEPWASTWGAVKKAPPVASFVQENVRLNVDPNEVVKQGEECKGLKRKREEDGGSDDDESVPERPPKRMCVGQQWITHIEGEELGNLSDD